MSETADPLTWPPVLLYTVPCGVTGGMCVVSARGGEVVVTDRRRRRVDVFSVTSGSLLRSLPDRFAFGTGGVCTTRRDTVLLAEDGADRVVELEVGDGSCVRIVGDGVLARPQYVACDDDAIAVSEAGNTVAVLRWSDGSLRTRLGGWRPGGGGGVGGPAAFAHPAGLRLLPDGAGVVVADHWGHRVVVAAFDGTVTAEINQIPFPNDVVVTAEGELLVAGFGGNELLRATVGGAVVDTFGRHSHGRGDDATRTAFHHPPYALALLPGGGLVVRTPQSFQVGDVLWCSRDGVVSANVWGVADVG